MTNIPEIFGSMVFNETVMKERLPREIYKALKKTINNGESLDRHVADIIAGAMKDWAIENGATHYTHWFQPMTGITAEKHDSFITPSTGGNVLMEFSGKELIKGEPDASSFPSGGLRATFEARGYTAWDPTSYVFIKDGTLCIPTAFCSFGGESLDKKTPLLRSVEAVSRQAVRILKLFGKTDVTRVVPTVGPEQEYFLIDKEMFEKRKDLIYCGRTLFGTPAPKGQELEDHYFGKLKPRVSAYMKELDQELWKLGILAKTKHNEAAPAQHELAPIFTTVNIATDHNQLTMEMMKVVADRHGMTCLLHEKPFEGVNGSGKHNNWSLTTNTGENLFEPGKSPHENAQFLVFLCAVMSAVHKHQDLLRISAASAGNDHRLGGHEAPPAIISMFLGSELAGVLDAIKHDNGYSTEGKQTMKVGVNALPAFPKDSTDRNRTSPFAFTGNKFEFRMLGSSASIACSNIMLNTMVADELMLFADELEGQEDFLSAVHALVKRTIINHDAIIFDGNGYSEEWVQEAEKRGLLNLTSTVDALPYYIRQENLDMFKRHKVYNETEMRARYEILLQEYSKLVNIEGLVMVDMVKKDYSPAIRDIQKGLCDTILSKRQVSETIPCKTETEALNKIAAAADEITEVNNSLDAALKNVPVGTALEVAIHYRNQVVPKMAQLRKLVDNIEAESDRGYWPVPS
ncbi:MAG: glutamine synthetase III, partial [Clostridia bacterium]|nr:glutamine synthetase III [Clostridia bacterium]